MTTALRERPAPAGAAGNGGAPARRAVIRWAWRLLRREWRQQLLILGLVTVAVAATIVGAAVATTTPPAANAGFGTAQDLATYQAPDPHLASQIAALQHRFGRVDVIENEAVAIPGSIDTYDLRAQNPRGPYGQPMLSLVSGHYPAGPGQVAVTSDLAATFHLKVGDRWRTGGTTRRVTGIVTNPQNLVDEFALVVPGQVTAPTQVTVLFDAHGVPPHKIGPYVSTPHSASSGNVLNPETIVLALATVGMLLIALVGIGGFTVLAQRRLRSLGLLAAQGATARNIRLVVRANGVLVGILGAVAGFVLGLAAWLAYRPSVETDAHHAIGAFQLPWTVIGVAMALAVIATYFAAARPARAVTRIPVVTALSGRPAPPRPIRRSALPGLIVLVGAAVLFAFSGTTNGNGSGGSLELVLGFVALIAAVILLAPACLTLLARLGRRAPIAARLALRDLARYRARSGSALAAITLGVLIAVLVSILSAQRFSNVLDYAGPNVASDQLIVYTPNGQGGGRASGPTGPVTASELASMAKAAHGIAAALGSHDVVELESTSASLQHAASGRSWAGQVYVATPQLLRAFGISASQVSPSADILSMRPGLSGLTKMQLVYGNYFRQQHPAVAQAAATARRPAILPLPEELVPGQPGDPGGQRASVRHVGAEHRDHRARHRRAPPAIQRDGGRLADPDAEPAHRRADHQRPAHRGRGRPDHRNQEQHPVGGGDHQLGDRVRHRARAGHPGHDARPHPQRNRRRPAYPGRHRGQRLDPPHPDRGHGGSPRPGGRGPRHGGGLHRGYRLRLG